MLGGGVFFEDPLPLPEVSPIFISTII